MDVATVVERFALGEAMGVWLAEAAALPSYGVGAVPARADAEAALAPFALDSADRAELVELWPDGFWPAELWWLVERMCARLAADLEPPGPGWRHWPPLTHVPDDRVRCAPVFAFTAMVPALRAAHRRLGVCAEVSAATLADIGRHVAQTRQMFGRLGLETASWIALHFRAGLFELGRLQYEPANLGPRGSITWYGEREAAAKGAEFQHGAPVLRLHIPAGAPLDPAGIEESLARARGFFRARTGVDYPVATCTSWLLDPQLARYLPERSNIMAFQRRFTLVEQDAPGEADVFRFVFRSPQVRPEQVPQNTRLERALVRHLRAGREWRVRTGWLLL